MGTILQPLLLQHRLLYAIFCYHSWIFSMLWLHHCFFTFSLPPKHMYLKTHQKWINPPTRGRRVCKLDSELFSWLRWWKGRGSPQTVLGNRQLILILEAMLGFAAVGRGAWKGCSPLQPGSNPDPTSPSTTHPPQRAGGGNAELAPQQHQYPQHEPQPHWAREEKSGGSSGLARPGKARALLSAEERGLRCRGMVVSAQAQLGARMGCGCAGRPTLILLYAHARRLLLFAFSFSPIRRCRLVSCPQELLWAREQVCRRRWREQGCQGTLMRATSILMVQLRGT